MGASKQFRIGLVLHPHRDDTAIMQTLLDWVGGHGAHVLVRDADAARCPPGVVAVADDGFVEQIEAEDFTLEQHSALLVRGAGDELVGFNDVALVRIPGEGVVQATLAVGGQKLGRFRCDGLVVSTPIGSTAYAYAAGGPVVSPNLDAVIIAPLAPMAGISRPMIMSASEPIRLELLPESGRLAIEVDGLKVREAGAGDAFDVVLSPSAGQVVRLDRDRYQRRNQVKLSLLDLPFLPDELRELSPART